MTYRRVKSESGLDLFVHYDVNLDSALGGSLKHDIETILLVTRWWTPKVELRTQPPVENIDALLRPCQASVSGNTLKWNASARKADGSYVGEPQTRPRSRSSHRQTT
jgi:hypothetical protein